MTKTSEYNKRWRAKHPEKIAKYREQSRLYALAHKNERAVWRKANPDKLHAQRLRDYAKDPDAARKRSRDYANALRLRVLTAYSPLLQCACCGDSHIEFLALDHVNNDGVSQRKQLGGSSYIYRWVEKNNFPEGFQVLCHNCNMAKGCYGRCPHVKELQEKAA